MGAEDDAYNRACAAAEQESATVQKTIENITADDIYEYLDGRDALRLILDIKDKYGFTWDDLIE